MVSWNNVSDYFGEFTGDIFGNHLILGGLIIFLFFIFLTLLLFGGNIALVSIPLLPLIFWLSTAFALGDLLILVAIMVGILFGFALIKWYRR
jgi:hypothetical protein